MKNEIKASVSGIRGVVGETLTPPVVLGYLTAYAGWLGGGRLALGRDTRPHGPAIQSFAESVLMACGIDVIDLGVVPTPTLLHFVRENGLAGGILITASHNPIEWNALKLVKKGGHFLTQEDFEAVRGRFSDEAPAGLYKSASQIGKKSHDTSAVAQHIETFVKKCDLANIAASKFRVAVDPGNGAGAVMDAEFLTRLGCSVHTIHDKAEGVFSRPPEPRAEVLTDLAALVVREHCQLGFAQDPDADRLCVVDELGNALSEEMTLVLAVWSWLLSQGQALSLKSPIVANISTSRMVSDLARHYGHPFIISKVGEANVLETMLASGAGIGGEGNGGVIYPALNACRDSFVGMYLIMDLITRLGEPLSKIVGKFHETIAPRYTMCKDKVPYTGNLASGLARMRTAFAQPGEKIVETDIDGLRIDFDKAWIHLRESNTESVVRLIAEADSAERANQLVALAKTALG